MWSLSPLFCLPCWGIDQIDHCIVRQNSSFDLWNIIAIVCLMTSDTWGGKHQICLSQLHSDHQLQATLLSLPPSRSVCNLKKISHQHHLHPWALSFLQERVLGTWLLAMYSFLYNFFWRVYDTYNFNQHCAFYCILPQGQACVQPSLQGRWIPKKCYNGICIESLWFLSSDILQFAYLVCGFALLHQSSLTLYCFWSLQNWLPSLWRRSHCLAFWWASQKPHIWTQSLMLAVSVSPLSAHQLWWRESKQNSKMRLWLIKLSTSMQPLLSWQRVQLSAADPGPDINDSGSRSCFCSLEMCFFLNRGYLLGSWTSLQQSQLQRAVLVKSWMLHQRLNFCQAAFATLAFSWCPCIAYLRVKGWILNHTIHKDWQVILDHEGFDSCLLMLLAFRHHLHQAPENLL